jgi:hypothetical protein
VVDRAVCVVARPLEQRLSNAMHAFHSMWARSVHAWRRSHGSPSSMRASPSHVPRYENSGSTPPTWTRRVISSSAMGARGVFAEDLDGDGAPDVMSAAFDGNSIAW